MIAFDCHFDNLIASPRSIQEIIAECEPVETGTLLGSCRLVTSALLPDNMIVLRDGDMFVKIVYLEQR